MVEWSKWAIIGIIILAVFAAIWVNAEQNKKEDCIEMCCTEDPIANSFCAIDCTQFDLNCCKENPNTCEGITNDI